jgi:aminoglycoside/choline kinase family phosphotransferase
MDLFETWYLGLHKNRPMSIDELAIWQNVRRLLIGSAREQPQVFVHKDFHSCNLLQTGDGPGIIDFQDGLRGPISYDFVSLVWDRYIAWPREQIETWMQQVHELFRVDCGFEEWVRYCDWMGLQRNLKIVGIFARLRHRDGKIGYVEMIPRFYQYLLDVLPRYSEFDDFRQLLEQKDCAP